MFVSTTNHNGSKEFTVILPGCRVLAEKRDNGTYFITLIDAALDYHQQQRISKKPGLHRASKAEGNWKTLPLLEGLPTGKNDTNIIGVGDRGYDDADDAALLLAERIKPTVHQAIERTGFDLFFTPGKKRIGGLMNYRQAINAEKDKDLHESAYLLAETMKKARGMENITWFADFGGSGVVTQAMRILKDQNVQLTGHRLYLHRPTTRTDVAYDLSQSLGMTLDRDFIKRDSLNINELIGAGSLTMAFKRLGSKSDNYTLLNGVVDSAKSMGNARGLAKTAMALGGAAAAFAALPAVATVSAAIIAAAPLVMSHAPDTVDRVKARL